ncbi:hypothetical protein F5X97DRAFT_323010 [Nemania serpens]|nr:hypothetical protein F5X97DRAFT_323010 [Nemania serpens]
MHEVEGLVVAVLLWNVIRSQRTEDSIKLTFGRWLLVYMDLPNTTSSIKLIFGVGIMSVAHSVAGHATIVNAATNTDGTHQTWEAITVMTTPPTRNPRNRDDMAADFPLVTTILVD